MSAQTVLFDAPGPRARRRHTILTVFGFVLAVATLALVLWKFSAQGQLEPSMWTSLFTADVWTCAGSVVSSSSSSVRSRCC